MSYKALSQSILKSDAYETNEIKSRRKANKPYFWQQNSHRRKVEFSLNQSSVASLNVQRTKELGASCIVR